MGYTTVDRLLTTYPRMASTNATSATLFNFVEKGATYIDGYIFTVVSSVPVSPAPPLLRDLNEDLSYVMFLRRHVHEASKESSINDLWKECVTRLENIRNGLVTIVSSAGLEISNTSRTASPWSNVSAYTPVFGVSDIEDEKVDLDRIDDESGSRD